VSGCYALLSFYKFIPSLDGVKATKMWAAKAIQLDPNSAEAHCFLGFVALFHESEWGRAEQLLKKSIDLSPNYPFPQAIYAFYLLGVKAEPLQAEKQARNSSKLDPLFFLPYNQLGQALMAQGKYDLGLKSIQKSIDLNTSADSPYMAMADALQHLDRANEAAELIEKNMSVTGRTQYMLIALLEALVKNGKVEQVIKINNEIQEMNRSVIIEPFTLGVAAAAVGKVDDAFRYFDLALEQKNSGFATWSRNYYYHPAWRLALQKDPRYKKIMDRLAFPEK